MRLSTVLKSSTAIKTKIRVLARHDIAPSEQPIVTVGMIILSYGLALSESAVR